MPWHLSPVQRCAVWGVTTEGSERVCLCGYPKLFSSLGDVVNQGYTVSDSEPSKVEDLTWETSDLSCVHKLQREDGGVGLRIRRRIRASVRKACAGCLKKQGKDQ